MAVPLYSKPYQQVWFEENIFVETFPLAVSYLLFFVAFMETIGLETNTEQQNAKMNTSTWLKPR